MSDQKAWEILEAMNPLLPALQDGNMEDWTRGQLLKDDVREFGREGTMRLPTVQRWLERLRDISL